MDEFRELQKKECNDGSRNKKGKYGCACCRKLYKLNHFKKMSRRLAKARLRQRFKKEITNAYTDL